jgi:hypothetical protein
MREIKFRGQDEFGYWQYGYLVDIGYGDFQIFNGMNDFEDVDKDTIGQFTGYYDCTNKEIYEGDIINYKDELVVCIYSKSYAGFFLSKNRNKSSDYYFLRKDERFKNSWEYSR